MQLVIIVISCFCNHLNTLIIYILHILINMDLKMFLGQPKPKATCLTHTKMCHLTFNINLLLFVTQLTHLSPLVFLCSSKVTHLIVASSSWLLIFLIPRFLDGVAPHILSNHILVPSPVTNVSNKNQQHYNKLYIKQI